MIPIPKHRVMISGAGWPIGGGMNMGCNVAGVDELNKLMLDFVCTKNARGMKYFVVLISSVSNI
jgi:exo-beta-1,3-glucanase (GH17 family)